MTDPAHWRDCDGAGREPCHACGGEGGYHDCGEDCCACLDPDELTTRCGECDGRGCFRCPGCLANDEAYDWIRERASKPPLGHRAWARAASVVLGAAWQHSGADKRWLRVDGACWFAESWGGEPTRVAFARRCGHRAWFRDVGHVGADGAVTLEPGGSTRQRRRRLLALRALWRALVNDGWWGAPCVACPRCGGSGFAGYGTGYDAVCSEGWCEAHAPASARRLP